MLVKSHSTVLMLGHMYQTDEEMLSVYPKKALGGTDLVLVEYLEDIIENCDDYPSLKSGIGHVVAFVRPHDGWSGLRSVQNKRSRAWSLTPSIYQDWQCSYD